MLMTSCFNARLPSEVYKNAIISKFVETKGIEVVRAANELQMHCPFLQSNFVSHATSRLKKRVFLGKPQ